MDKAMYSLIPKQEKIISTIISSADPDQIILFGSYARGEAKKDSDVDILVLKKGLTKWWELCGNIHIALGEQRIGIPIDVIVADYDKFLETKQDIGYVFHTIDREGKVLYGKL